MRTRLASSLPAAIAAALLVLTCGGAPGAAEPSLYPWEGPRLGGVPTPKAILGYELCERIAGHAEVLRYLDALASSSDRVRVYDYGRSHEGRLLRYAVISSAANIARLQEIREAAQSLAAIGGQGASGTDGLVSRSPVIVWIAASVHGDEASSTEAALAAAYHLASAEDERTKRILEQAVVVINPLQNPDGRERFALTQVQASGPIPAGDPAAAEHEEPWPSGRFNHDLFDLNRDWVWLTQPETRGMVAAFLAWRPQVFVDLHEMWPDSTYYFAPPRQPINPAVHESILKWFKVIGEGNARIFDTLGFDYFTEEVFDLFYPGYGDTWPSLNGAIGMTYEQATVGGLVIERKDGTLLTFRDAARRHIASILATAETAAANREGILEDYVAARRASLKEPAGSGARAYLIPPGGDGEAIGRILTAAGLDLRRSREEFTARAAAEPGAPAEERKFPRGTLIAPLAQPFARLLAALFDRDPQIDERTLDEARERRRLRSDAPFYDITAWSIPLAMNVRVLATPDPIRVPSDPLPRTVAAGLPGHPAPPPGTGPWPPAVTGRAPSNAGAGNGHSLAIPRASYAYLLPPEGNDSLAALVTLLRRGDLRLHVAGKRFTLQGRAYPAGTAVLKVGRNPDEIHAAVSEAAARHMATFEPVSTGLTEDGIDLGSNSVASVRLPRIAVAWGEPLAPTSVGWLTYLLGERFELPFSRVRVRTLAREADLRRYDVIVIPDGSAARLKETFGDEGLKRLRSWMEAGGTVVAIRGASALAADKDVAWTSSRLVKRPRTAPFAPAGSQPGGAPTSPPDRKGEPRAGASNAAAEPAPGAAPAAGATESEEGEAPDFVPGAILRVLLEPSHPLAFGYGEEVPVLVTSNLVFSLSSDGANAAVYAPRDRLRLSGFAWPESLDLLAGKAFAVAEKVGRGNLVLFADDPNFRGGWEGLSRMVLNAILLVPAFED